ncbi:MAG: M23 family metallopeptidase [Bdellovibrionales bacterium]|nr:M23 family metallopeptidase [Bdellovibrionales bacterium]
MRRYGFTERSVATVLGENLFPKSFTLVPGSVYKVTRLTQASRTELKFYDPDQDNSFVVWQEAGAAGSGVQSEQYEVRTKELVGKVRGSLIESITKHVPDKWVAYRFMDAYLLDFNLQRALQRNAHYRLVYEEKYEGTRLIKYGEVLETELEINGKKHRRKFVRFEGGGSYVSPDGEGHDKPLYSPVAYQHYSSLFKPRRFHPIKKRRQAHLGLDFELPAGHAVYTVQSGRVLRTGKNRAAGNFVVVRHQSGLESYYNHLQSISPEVKKGRQVFNGQKLGTIGCTGYCTKAHLHFAVKKAGRYLNPAKYLKPFPFKGQRLVGQQLARFEE